MGLTDTIAELFLKAGDSIRPIGGERDARWLSIGTIDYYVTPALLAAHALPAPEQSDPGEDEHARSKRSTASFAAALGYASYEELDINERADVRHDLNFPVPDSLREGYDLVWDCGSVEHVMNAFQANRNILDLVRVGGVVVCQQGIGDQTNAGYWTISPNFYVDFLAANGVEVLEFVLSDRRGNTFRANEVMTKGQPVGQMLPLVRLPGYYLRTLRADAVARLLSRHRFPARAVASLEYRAPPLGRLTNVVLGRTPRGGPEWFTFVVGRKTAQLSESVRIQNIYRDST